jgi:transcriptional regulator of acetoin/glycerol metabolism
MDAAISRAKRMLGKDIPILIEGSRGPARSCSLGYAQKAAARRPDLRRRELCRHSGRSDRVRAVRLRRGAFTSAKRKGNTGKIQMADRGTLCLDEIGDRPRALQASLLRVLQERVVTPLGSSKAYPVDIAVICATHRRLREMVASGCFREDLYYRLNVVKLYIPALAERREDIPLLEKLVAQENRTGGLSISKMR